MSFTLQAPTLMGNGEEYPGLVGAKRPGTFHCISAELWDCVHAVIPAKNGAERTLIIFLLGQNQTGKFNVAKKTIITRCGLSPKVYYEARQKLIERGFLTFDEEKNILYINYNNIRRAAGHKINTSFDMDEEEFV